ncbi:MAG: 16S rRNA (adenine(1518)-N(6)/adenine(1519)-N(6))-dimethyltransferase RsmA [Candidatus Aenigmatarchaeota archaeon]
MPRKLGQHFLKYPEIAERMAALAIVDDCDIVLEIGPGHGELTQVLASKAKKVIAIEKDKMLAEALEGKLSNVEVIAGDAVKLEWPHFDKLVANLPYEISSPVMEKLFERKHWKVAVLMLQKEFAKRLTAKEGSEEWSRLGMAASYYVDAKLIAKVGRGAFRPMPKVESAIVLMKPREHPFKTDSLFWLVTGKLWQHRKKQVRAALKHLGRYDGCGVGIDFVPHGIAEKRVERCSLEDFRLIVDTLREHLGSG